MKNDNYVCLGVIRKPVGIRGDVKIHPYTLSPATFLTYRDCLMLDSQPLTCVSARVGKHGSIIARFNEFQSRCRVEPLRMCRLFVPREKFPPTQQDEYYLCDLDGLDVLSDSDGKLLGKVLSAQDYGAGAFLEISLLDDKESYTLPFHKESILSVDLFAKQIKISEKYLISSSISGKSFSKC
ncbi:MAG: ribosome maturation factor RimM [Holosporales bacterium]|jgi:16S rRNA processing protein RimM|nr:ribosome maturation factor RimM [Holosporales bacterium]